MATDIARVIEKVKKLLALGTSPNQHEAAAAVAKAQEMLAAYDLTMESVEDLKSDPRTSVRKTGGVVSVTEGKPDGWKQSLFEAVAKVHDCYVMYQGHMETSPSGKTRRYVRTGILVGFGHDVEAAGYSLNFLIREIERLAAEYSSVMWQEIETMMLDLGITHQQAESTYTISTGRHPLKAKIYFIKGAAEEVCKDLYDAYWTRREEIRIREQKDSNSNPYAIVSMKASAVEDFVYRERYGMSKAEAEAKWAADAARWKAEHEAAIAKEPEPEETPAQRRKREEREEREAARRRERWERREERERAAMDGEAHRAGRRAGSEIKIRPGVNPGSAVPALED